MFEQGNEKLWEKFECCCFQNILVSLDASTSKQLVAYTRAFLSSLELTFSLMPIYSHRLRLETCPCQFWSTACLNNSKRGHCTSWDSSLSRHGRCCCCCCCLPRSLSNTLEQKQSWILIIRHNDLLICAFLFIYKSKKMLCLIFVFSIPKFSKKRKFFYFNINFLFILIGLWSTITFI